MSKLSIIPESIDPSTNEGREKLREFLKEFLGKHDKTQVKVIALRVAMRAAWRLQALKVKDKKKLDPFYGFWIRAISAASAVVFAENNESIELTNAPCYGIKP